MIYGARIIAQALHDLGVSVLFGVAGLPITEVASESLNLGIRFVSFRNEQAAVYAAAAYGYLTGRPGVCICVGGPGALHVFAGIPHATANSWPLLVLAGSSEVHNGGKEAFQELDAISLTRPYTKYSVRPHAADNIPKALKDAYRSAWFGRPGPAFVDLPANLILGHFNVEPPRIPKLLEPPKSMAPLNKIKEVVAAVKAAKAPLIVIGKGVAYARAEQQVRALVNQ